MGISKEKYLNKVDDTKDIALPSLEDGETFTIRKVKGRELVGEYLPLTSMDDLRGDKKENKAENMSPDDREKILDFNLSVVHKALVEPKLSKEELKSIPDEDWEKLLTEVNEHSLKRVEEVSPTKGTA